MLSNGRGGFYNLLGTASGYSTVIYETDRFHKDIQWKMYPVVLSTFASFSLSFFFISAVLVGLYRYLRFPVHS